MTQSLESQYQLFLRKRNLTIIAAKDSVLLHDGQKQTPDHCLQMQRWDFLPPIFLESLNMLGF